MSWELRAVSGRFPKRRFKDGGRLHGRISDRIYQYRKRSVQKSVVNIRYSLGFERVIRAAIANFRAMGLKPVIYRAASGVITKREHHKIGYFGAVANWQYEYDHRQDQALFMDKRYIERRLEVMHTVYEQNKEQAAQFAGPAVMETFGEKPFSPKAVPEAPAYCEEQRSLRFNTTADPVRSQMNISKEKREVLRSLHILCRRSVRNMKKFSMK